MVSALLRPTSCPWNCSDMRCAAPFRLTLLSRATAPVDSVS